MLSWPLSLQFNRHRALFVENSEGASLDDSSQFTHSLAQVHGSHSLRYGISRYRGLHVRSTLVTVVPSASRDSSSTTSSQELPRESSRRTHVGHIPTERYLSRSAPCTLGTPLQQHHPTSTRRSKQFVRRIQFRLHEARKHCPWSLVACHCFDAILGAEVGRREIGFVALPATPDVTATRETDQ